MYTEQIKISLVMLKKVSSFHQTKFSKNLIPFLSDDFTRMVIPPELLFELGDTSLQHLEKEQYPSISTFAFKFPLERFSQIAQFLK